MYLIMRRIGGLDPEIDHGRPENPVPFDRHGGQ